MAKSGGGGGRGGSGNNRAGGRLSKGQEGFVYNASSGDSNYGMAARVVRANRRSVTVQFLGGYGKLGRTETYRNQNLAMRPFNANERATIVG